MEPSSSSPCTTASMTLATGPRPTQTSGPPSCSFASAHRAVAPAPCPGHNLYESAKRLRLPELPAFALEHLPNRNSLIYGDLYGISKEASTIYRATLRYEGFSEIMATLTKIGFFDAANHPLLEDTNHPTHKGFLDELLNNISTTNTDFDIEASGGYDDELIARLLKLAHCKDTEIAVKTVKTIKLVLIPCYKIHIFYELL
uniref:Saccharopine dehydrogenase-like C-terminal domain-containing protein n=1 Tax=Zea mays TaxID=4577 RepID=A0A804N2G0_MAIZE